MRMLIAAAVLCAATLPASADCASEIDAVLDASLTTVPYRMTSTVTPGPDAEMISEIVPPGRYRTIMTMDGTSIETIVIGEQGWTKAGDVWTPISDTLAAQMITGFSAGAADADRSIEDAQCLGIQTIDGAEYAVFSFAAEAAGAGGVTTIYADPVTLRAARFEGRVESPNGVLYENTTTFTYDPAITIEAPLPVAPAAN
jgi:hypothetical protein